MEKVTITVSGILEDLENGLTRTPNSKGYNSEIGSITEKYEISDKEVRELFKHPKLKGRKTKKVKELSFELIDDTIQETENTPTNQELTDTEAGQSDSEENMYEKFNS